MSRRERSIRTAIAILLGLFVSGALACSGLRRGTGDRPPAPDFHTISDEQLQSAMWQLADGVLRLQAMFGSEGPIRHSQRPEVVAILDGMIEASQKLGPDGVETNHARISNHLIRFREKLVIARDAASMNPPRYFLVGNLSGTCMACHDGGPPRRTRPSPEPPAP